MKIFKIAILIAFATLSAYASRCLPAYMHDRCSVNGYGIIEIEKVPHVTHRTKHRPKTHKRSRGKKYYVKKCRKVVRYR